MLSTTASSASAGPCIDPRSVEGIDAPFDACPRCSGEHFTPEVSPHAVVLFRCTKCGTRWQFELGHVRPVSGATA